MPFYRITRRCLLFGTLYEAGTVIEIGEKIIAAQISSASEGLLEPVTTTAPAVETHMTERAAETHIADPVQRKAKRSKL